MRTRRRQRKTRRRRRRQASGKARRRQSGGTRRAASGFSGCVLIPGLVPNSAPQNSGQNEDPTKVTKIFFREADFPKEVAALTLAEEADPGHEFTIRGIPGHMDIDTDLLTLCNESMFNKNATGKYYVIHYDNAGVELASLPPNSAYLCPLITLFRHVCEMNKRSIIHGDITPANIAFKDGTFRLIDYGLMRRAEGDPRDKLDILAMRNFLIEYLSKLDMNTAAIVAIPLSWAAGPGPAELADMMLAALNTICPFA